MFPEIVSLGELLVEIMRSEIDQPLNQAAAFIGPYPSGAPAIFIDAATRLGKSTGFVGAVGADSFGDCIKTRLERDHIDAQCVRTVTNMTTGIAFVAYRRDGGRNFVFHLAQSAAATLNPEDIQPEYLQRVKFLHITGSALSFCESSRKACYRAVEIVKRQGGKISFDPNIRPELLGIEQLKSIVEPVLQVCDLLLPSEVEATMLTGDKDEITACKNLVKRGIPIVALKQGSQGSTIFTKNDQFHAEPIEVNEIDPTGAGDCYGGAFVVGLLSNWDLRKVARFANIVGGLSVTKMGPMEGAPAFNEVISYL
jgi:sugar/nucleoside kinase (ribokinase family)